MVNIVLLIVVTVDQIVAGAMENVFGTMADVIRSLVGEFCK